MKKQILEKYADTALVCPLCGGAVALREASLVCPKGHCFDISARGYVNFSGNPATRYGRELFLHRRRVFEAGLYDGAAEWLRANARGTALDAGCGEGFFTRLLGGDVYGLDLSREAIALASGSDQIRWLVADLAKIPLADGSVDTIVNVLSPASYSEFGRVLREGGRVLKIVPGRRYLAELRALAGMPEYGDGLPEARMAEFTDVESCESLCKTRALTPELASDVIAMSPLTFGAELSRLDPARLTEITVDLRMIIGRPLRAPKPSNG